VGLYFRQEYDKVLIVVVVVGLFLYASLQPSFQMRADMPSEFVDAPSSQSTEKRAAEEKIARAYWDCSITVIQGKYSHGHPLPLNPPDDFRVTRQDLGEDAADPAARARYWRRLQEVWYLPSTWRKVYEWDLSWMANPVKAAGEWLQDRFRKLIEI
jgi:hypothetical protein